MTSLYTASQDLKNKKGSIVPNKNSIDLPSIYQQFIHISRYARYNEELGRRETWTETVDRIHRLLQIT